MILDLSRSRSHILPFLSSELPTETEITAMSAPRAAFACENVLTEAQGSRLVGRNGNSITDTHVGIESEISEASPISVLR
jgi:hypothetical protein